MSTPQSYKPRRKRKGDELTVSHGTVETDPVTKAQKPAFPLIAFLWPAKGTVSQWILLPLILMAVGLFRWSTGLWGYSGFQSPPMHGDFEAQRHWMEVTTNLPVSQWYFHDLEWWGLDYPPLTAYHSWLLGKVGSFIDASWFSLHNSRGLDDPILKIYMRATVFVSEYLIYIPAAVICLRRYSRLFGVNSWEASVALVAFLMLPGTMLIDHGHFQYNTVMLGLVLASMSSMLAGRNIWSCVFFVGALGFKQMALFYAPAVFVYLLGSCIFPKIRPLHLVFIAAATVASFGILYAPFIAGVLYDSHRGLDITDLPPPPLLRSLPIKINSDAWYYPVALQLAQSIHRIFPFARGLFEDKVANVWCALHTFHKLHQYPSALVQRVALTATTTAIAPPCLILFFRPRKELIPLAFAATSWGFFLCSYQVHEKNVLLPLLPMSVLLSGSGGLLPSVRAWVGLANMLGAWTMFPLLKRDELRVPYFVLTLLWAYLLGLPPTSLSIFRNPPSGGLNIVSKLLHAALYLAMCLWHVAEAFLATPTNKPDLWIVANVLVGAAGFGLCYLWCLWTLMVNSGSLEPLEEIKLVKTETKAKSR